MEIVPIIDEGLGNSAYLVGLGDGGALVIDPSRDPAAVLEISEQRGWRIRFTAETHLHADFVSGGREFAALGAELLASARAPLAFDAHHLDDDGEVDLGGLVLRAIATPGHTPEHLAYLLLDGSTPVAVFTGGTLIVGGVARPDLLGPEQTEPLARAAYHSLRDRLLGLPDELAVYPTHGPGSFCSTGASDQRTTTIGAERAGNPLLQARDEDDFVSRLLGGLGSFPPYFLELRQVNRAGPAVYGPAGPPLPALGIAAVERAVAAGAELVDVRGMDAFADGHVPGALSNPLRPAFRTWLGWLVDRERSLVFITDVTTDTRELIWDCLSIGFERLAGELAGGMPAWVAAGRPVERIPLLPAPNVDRGRRVIDVRQRDEWDDGHIRDAVHVELGALAERAAQFGDDRVVVHCGHGERAMTAASLLTRAGHRDATVLAGGPDDLAEAGWELRSS